MFLAFNHKKDRRLNLTISLVGECAISFLPNNLNIRNQINWTKDFFFFCHLINFQIERGDEKDTTKNKFLTITDQVIKFHHKMYNQKQMIDAFLQLTTSRNILDLGSIILSRIKLSFECIWWCNNAKQIKKSSKRELYLKKYHRCQINLSARQ